MRLISANNWDEPFFSSFCAFRNRLYESNIDHVPESIDDLRLFWGSGSSFAQTRKWKACQVLDSEKEVCGRFLLSFDPRSKQDTLYIGYFECAQDETAREFLKTSLLIEIKKMKAAHPNLAKVTGPIQGSIFNSARFRAPTEHAYFFGESLHQDFYAKLLEEIGFSRDGEWTSYETDPNATIANNKKVLERVAKTIPAGTRVRRISKESRDDDLRAIYDITMEAYGFQGTNDFISYDIFRGLADKMLPWVSPRYVKVFEEKDGHVTAFQISLPDIQPDIRWYKRASKSFGFLGLALKAILFARMNFLRHDVLILYVAKSARCSARFVIPLLGAEMTKDLAPLKPAKAIFCHNAEGSGARSTLPVDKKVYSTHFLMVRFL